MSVTPWLDGWAPFGAWALNAAVPLHEFLEQVNEAARLGGLQSGGQMPLLFEPAANPLSAVDYELTIARTGRVPTRDNLHDRYNAAAWLSFPKTKQLLNQIQMTEAAQATDRRSRLRDAVTLFDENGAVFITGNPAVSQALQGFEWKRLFIQLRQEVIDRSRVYVLGHGLMEKLEQPFLSLCAHAAVITVSVDAFEEMVSWPVAAQRAWVDVRLSVWLQAHLQQSRHLQPLPVLGVPGWWPDNELQNFYDNTSVFRPGRLRFMADSSS